MKSLNRVVAAAVLSGLTAVAAADDYSGASYSDWARVTRVTPQYERVNEPSRECRVETVYSEEPVQVRPRDRSPAGVIIGGVTGGIVGHQVGKGQGRAAATAIGAVVGAIVGDRIDNGAPQTRRVEYYEPREQQIKRCRMVDNWSNRLTGYVVDYEYNGRSYSRLMNEDPGRRFRVRVSVEPE